MDQIDSSTVEMSDDEQIIGDFYLYLREERGLTRENALKYLYQVSALAGRMDATEPMMTDQLLDHLDDKAPQEARGGMYADADGNWVSQEAENAWYEQHKPGLS